MDLTGYHCELWDLENRRPMVVEVEAGVRASVVNGDVLSIAVK